MHQPGDFLGAYRTAVQPGRADHLVEVIDLAVQRDQFGVHRLREHPAQQRRGALDGAVHHVAGLHLDAQVDLFLRHRPAHQLLLFADHVIVEGQRAGRVRHRVARVVHVRLGPHPDRVRPVGHPQVHPAALQLRVLAGDRGDQVLALRIGAEGPALRGKPVPGEHVLTGTHQMTVDGPRADRRRVVRDRLLVAGSSAAFGRLALGTADLAVRTAGTRNLVRVALTASPATEHREPPCYACACWEPSCGLWAARAGPATAVAASNGPAWTSWGEGAAPAP